MEWDKDAMDATKEIPFFLRKMIRGRIESAIAEKGRSRVTLEDVKELRQKAGAKHGVGKQNQATDENGSLTIHANSAEDPNPAPRSTDRSDTDPKQRPGQTSQPTLSADGKVTQESFAALEKLINSDHTFDTRYYNVKGCGGAAGCPLTLVNTTFATDLVISELENNNLERFMANNVRGPVLSHHKFKASVAGCANCCSEPQIKDVGIIAQMSPGVSEEQCIECMQCVEICKEGSVNVINAVPAFDRDLCMSCGECIRVCPTGAIRVEKEGYAVLIGGSLAAMRALG